MLDRKNVNVEFAKWMLDDPSPANIEFIEEMSNHTPDSIAALLNTSYWFLDDAPTLGRADIGSLYALPIECGQYLTEARSRREAYEAYSYNSRLRLISQRCTGTARRRMSVSAWQICLQARDSY
jgi:hypothetical protein